MRSSFIITACLGLSLLQISEARAFSLAITNRTYPNGNQAAMDVLANQIQNTFNQTIASTNQQSDFLNSVGNANALAGRSFLSPGVIQADQNFSLNVGGSAALAIGDGASLSKGISFPSNELPPIGVGAKAGVTLGMPGRILPQIGNLDRSRTMVSVSFYSLDAGKYIGHGVSMTTTEASIGAAYQLYPSQSWTPLIRFNGFRIATGLAYSNFDASYSTQFNLSATDAGTGAKMAFNNNVNVGVNSSVFSLTNEVTTGLRFFWIWNVYTGIGVDFNVGSSSITGGSNGPVTASAGATQYFTGTAVISGSSESIAPTFAQLRYLLGTEVDLGPVGVYLQGQASTPSVYGLNFGAHFLF